MNLATAPTDHEREQARAAGTGAPGCGAELIVLENRIRA